MKNKKKESRNVQNRVDAYLALLRKKVMLFMEPVHRTIKRLWLCPVYVMAPRSIFLYTLTLNWGSHNWARFNSLLFRVATLSHVCSCSSLKIAGNRAKKRQPKKLRIRVNNSLGIVYNFIWCWVIVVYFSSSHDICVGRDACFDYFLCCSTSFFSSRFITVCITITSNGKLTRSHKAYVCVARVRLTADSIEIPNVFYRFSHSFYCSTIHVHFILTHANVLVCAHIFPLVPNLNIKIGLYAIVFSNYRQRQYKL